MILIPFWYRSPNFGYHFGILEVEEIVIESKTNRDSEKRKNYDEDLPNNILR